MAKKRAKPEEIVSKLRQVEVLVGEGMPRADAIRQIGVTELTFSALHRRPKPDIGEVGSLSQARSR